MQHVAAGVPVHYEERGEGTPVFALHGAGVDHRELLACLEPTFAELPGYRRIYPDLPGMGRTPAPPSLTGADDVLEVLATFVADLAGDDPVLLVGHSAGAYYARALAARTGRVAGLALLCPLLPGLHDVPTHQVIAGGARGEAAFRAYFVVQTPAMLDRYEQFVAPGAALADQAALARIAAHWELTAPPVRYERPTLILTGRQDATVGHARAHDLLDEYPHATFAVLDAAGHALPHEQPGLLRALLCEWLDRVRADP